MANKKDSFGDFISRSTADDIKKPVNEFSEILNKIEKKPAPWFSLKWLVTGLSTACVVLAMASVFNYQKSGSISDDEISFLFDSYNGDIYEEDTEESFASLLEEA